MMFSMALFNKSNNSFAYGKGPFYCGKEYNIRLIIYPYHMRIKNKTFLYAISVVIAFGSFVFGYALVCISMMSDNIQAAAPVTADQFHFQLSLITTLLPLGAFLGSFLMQPICDRFGQNKAMIILDIFGTLTIILQAYEVSYSSLYIGRFLLGIYVGIVSGMIPVYLVSISPPEISGIVGSFNQLLITIGIAAAYGLGMINLSWQTYMSVPAFFCVARMVALMFFKFDRLQRHVSRGDNQALKNYINYFYQDCTVQQLKQVRNFKSKQQEIVKPKYQNEKCSQNLLGKVTGNAGGNVIKMALVLAVGNQFSGINAILFYANQVFNKITHQNKQLSLEYTFYLGILQVIVTFVSGFMINMFGRRTLMIVGQVIVVGSLLLGYFFEHWLHNQSLITIVVFTHIIGFSISLGPISMLYIAEMMENITLIVCAVWVFTLFVSMVSEIMIITYGIGNVFLFYGIISFCCLAYIMFNMVESKGLNRKELVGKYQGHVEDQEKVQLQEVQEDPEGDKNDSL